MGNHWRLLWSKIVVLLCKEVRRVFQAETEMTKRNTGTTYHRSVDNLLRTIGKSVKALWVLYNNHTTAVKKYPHDTTIKKHLFLSTFKACVEVSRSDVCAVWSWSMFDVWCSCRLSNSATAVLSLFNTDSPSCSCHGFSFAFHPHCLASFDLYCHDHRLLQPFFRHGLGPWLFSCFFLHF